MPFSETVANLCPLSLISSRLRAKLFQQILDLCALMMVYVFRSKLHRMADPTTLLGIAIIRFLGSLLMDNMPS